MSTDIPIRPIEPDEEDLITIFVGDLYNCRERERILEREGIASIIVGPTDGRVADLGPPVLQLQIRREDIQDTVEIFEEEWQEILDIEGLDAQEDVIDLNQDTIVCPGCGTEISEVTEEGECTECGLFLGLPDDEEEVIEEEIIEEG